MQYFQSVLRKDKIAIREPLIALEGYDVAEPWQILVAKNETVKVALVGREGNEYPAEMMRILKAQGQPSLFIFVRSFYAKQLVCFSRDIAKGMAIIEPMTMAKP